MKKTFDHISSEKYTSKFHNICSVVEYNLWFVSYYDGSCMSRHENVAVSRLMQLLCSPTLKNTAGRPAQTWRTPSHFQTVLTVYVAPKMKT